MNSDAARKTNAGAMFLLLSGVFAASVLLPLPRGRSGQIGRLPSICLFYHLTGLPCPGCGLTRSFVSLGHGHLLEALHWHPLGPAIFLLFGLLWLRCGVFWLHGKTLLPLPPRTVGSLSFAACAVLVLADLARIGWLSAHHLRF
jgi:hypothetical protein